MPNYPGGRSDGYIVNPDENDSAAQREECGREAGMGIVKTVDIELASRDASTEDILKGKVFS